MRAAGQVVEWKDKGFGFIQPESGGKDVFFHAADVESGPARVGTRVTFEVKDTDKGPRAVAVRARVPAYPYPPGPVTARGPLPATAPDTELEADLLSPDELWGELGPVLRREVIELARRHNWVED